MTNLEWLIKNDNTDLPICSMVALAQGYECGDCEKCPYYVMPRKDILKILAAEHFDNVNWSKVAVDTPILVSRDGKIWFNAHFKEYDGGEVYAYKDGQTSWTAYGRCIRWPYAKLGN